MGSSWQTRVVPYVRVPVQPARYARAPLLNRFPDAATRVERTLVPHPRFQAHLLLLASSQKTDRHTSFPCGSMR